VPRDEYEKEDAYVKNMVHISLKREKNKTRDMNLVNPS
jgi:hypothetical protein